MKLTKAQVEEIRRLYTTTNLSQAAIAKRVGRNKDFVSRIVNNKTYKKKG